MNQSASLFDLTATEFAAKIDRQIAAGSYRRGDLFVAASLAVAPPGGYILDYGCGPGRISRLLAKKGFKVLGVDFSSAMIGAARSQVLETLQVEFKTIDEMDKNAWEGQHGFDAVICSSVIEYISDPLSLLGRFAAVLRPSGALIISFANSRSIFRAPFQGRNLHLDAQRHTWTWPQFRSLLEQSEFQAVGSRQYFEGPVERVRPLSFLTASQFVGGLGLVKARKKTT